MGLQGINADEMTRKLEDMLPVIRQVNEQFKNPVSTFIPCPRLVISNVQTPNLRNLSKNIPSKSL
jgi:hypothetical protein